MKQLDKTFNLTPEVEVVEKKEVERNKNKIKK